MHNGELDIVEESFVSTALETAPARGTFEFQPVSTISRQRILASIHLTHRQLDVLALLCEGLTNKHIGQRLNIASATVKIHVSCILRELRVDSRLQAVIAARRLGLVTERAPVSARLPRARPRSRRSPALRVL
jgi:DNA-binding NarL/FixJ family response regulator